MYWTSIIILLSCKGCSWCAPGLPSNSPNDDVETEEDGETVDTSDSGTRDTGPPPACPTPEVEPNDTFGQAQEIPMESWVCGVLSEDGGIDIFKFENAAPGWMQIWGRAADLGSNADIFLSISDSTETYKADLNASPGTTDANLVVPVPGGLTWFAALSDAQYSYSDEHIWRMIASYSSKAPVLWDYEETEPNDAITDSSGKSDKDQSQLIQSGDRIMGILSTGTDRDWYRVEVPAGRSTIKATVEAWNHGSPLDARISLRDPCKARPDGLTETITSGISSTDRDPAAEWPISEEGDWYILVKPDDDSAGIGGPMHWYVLEITVETDPPDTGSGSSEPNCDTGQASEAE